MPFPLTKADSNITAKVTKNLGRKSIFQIITTNPHGINAFTSTLLCCVSCYHGIIDSVAPPLIIYTTQPQIP